MKKALIGAGGFAREIKAHMGIPDLISFVSDEYWEKNTNNIYKLSEFNPKEFEVLVAIGDSKLRYDMIQKLPVDTKYFTFIHPSVQLLGCDIEIGEGSIICAGSILTTNIKIGKHAHINLNTTIGHDCLIGDYFTTAPAVNISGNCTIYDIVYIGTNTSVRERVSIHSMTTIGMNSGVITNIKDPGIYVGTPAKKIK